MYMLTYIHKCFYLCKNVTFATFKKIFERSEPPPSGNRPGRFTNCIHSIYIYIIHISEIYLFQICNRRHGLSRYFPYMDILIGKVKRITI